MATAQDIIKIMQDWIGTDKRQIIDLYNSHKPLAQGYAVKYTDAWCDTTVSAAFIKAGAVDLIGGTECGVERHIQLFKNAGIWNEDGTVTPEPGTIICYNWDQSTQPNNGYADHIGVVENVTNGQITVIEGNFNDAVKRRTIPVGWGYIRGYAFPKYDDAAVPQADPGNTVIDVSEWQGIIDWEKVKPQISAAIIRVAYSTVKTDDRVSRNISECERLGIPYGVYIYSLADRETVTRAEAERVLSIIKGHKLQLPVYLDLEEQKCSGYARRAAEVFCDLIKKAGYRCGVYASESYFNNFVYGANIPGCSYWIARYGTNDGRKQTKPNVKVNIDGWQYTSVGRFQGINGNVDTSEFYGDYDKDTSIRYQAHCQSYGWMDWACDGAWAGTQGEGKRMEGLIIDPPDGVVLDVDVHLQKIGWRTYEGIEHGNDRIIGTVGESRRMEAICIRCRKNTTGKKLMYQVHCQTHGTLPACAEGEVAGTTGQSKRLEAIRICME